MSPTSYQTALPRSRYSRQYRPTLRAVKMRRRGGAGGGRPAKTAVTALLRRGQAGRGRRPFNAAVEDRRYGSAVKRLGRIPALLDPGWLFVMAGLAMCAAVIIIPAEHSLQAMRQQVGQLKEEESLLAARLSAHASFLDELRRGEPALVRRLAAAQLNLVPEGERPVLLVRSASVSVEDWIERTVRDETAASPRPARSVLAMLTEGPQRLWVLGGSILSVFIGLLIGPSVSRSRPAGVLEAEEPDGAWREADGRAEVAERVVERPAPRSATALADSMPEPQPAKVISAEPVDETAEAAVQSVFSFDGASNAAGDEAGPVPCPAFPADHVGVLLVTNDIEDEVDVLDEDEVDQSSGTGGGDRSAHEAAPTADGPRHPTEEGVAEAREADKSAAGASSGDDEEEDEYEYIYEEVEVDGEPAADDDVEYIYEDADEAADPALPGDEDDEYEYEYIYVDEPEAEGEGDEATDEGDGPPDGGPQSKRGRRRGKRGSRGRR